jgi:hypothetical protein
MEALAALSPAIYFFSVARWAIGALNAAKVVLCGVYLEARECSYMQPDSNMSKVARAVITPNSTGICCAEFKMS